MEDLVSILERLAALEKRVMELENQAHFTHLPTYYDQTTRTVQAPYVPQQLTLL